MSLADLRREYTLASLDLTEVDPDPIVQFMRWFDEARRAEILEPNAMTLATVDADGRPSARVVLLKEVTPLGFVFFTDYRSRKGRDVEANPRAGLCFFWKEIERQVRIGGTVERLAVEESAAYFGSRPLGSRIGAWASVQSAVIPGRDWLEAEVERVRASYPDGDVPLPPHWGGYRVIPDELEFWQGRESRLHDRVRYLPNGSAWRVDRLSP
ncbi:MAG: pyridoxamine 5'-phosphate oxidase [Gemmatimonadetes bacterium]|jgi:pyridoxamine 5'-phosphate oxidase|nr:pyridoxamine 5'-phosphate oxidase [Gemmatimonadota bacterium]MCC7322451.1 pyridoxamine 5'-phosphate oxidase [Gemmatimonadaceae bacterium]MBK6454550.1 pyridoxamine 5'-phosphate oxidase [Gemmatimonadota bacterium]MBK6840757.1 pyridoxamine 5'-phosphate oxidase [Gemmatimonadota bacterium]MBK7834435.1 pyridoxamine 5'-phosphate oxidase [Gemmatimonadota bacterium]